MKKYTTYYANKNGSYNYYEHDKLADSPEPESLVACELENLPKDFFAKAKFTPDLEDKYLTVENKK